MAAMAAWLAATAVAAAEPVEVRLRIVGEDGAARAAFPVRVTIGSGPETRAPAAGFMLTTDADGKATVSTDAEVVGRKITLDIPFVKHDSRYLEVGVELDLVGRSALYVVGLDVLSSGTLGQMVAHVAGPDGVFDDMLTFHEDSHAWSFPDKPGGMMITNIGADLVRHSMDPAGASWVVDIEIRKYEFTVR